MTDGPVKTPLEFPCDFPIKAMGRHKDDFAQTILGIVHPDVLIAL